MANGPDYIDLPFGDGVYRFRLRFGEVVELQKECEAGPFEIFQRLSMGFPRIQDVRETIRIALLAGGRGWKGATDPAKLEGAEEIEVGPARANALVSRYVDTYAKSGPSWHESRLIAQAIIGAGLVGIPDEEIGKNGEGEETTPDPLPSQTAGSE